MDYVLGIDGGGTSTICLLTDLAGRTVAQTKAPASNHRKTDLRAARAAIAVGVSAVLEMAAAIVATPPRIIAACAGLAGVDTHADAALWRTHLAEIVATENLRVVNVGEIAIYGALADEPGVLVISGTGSIVWATAADGRRIRVGGWDYILSDEGSGYSIGLRVLRAVAAAHDQRTGPTGLTATVFRALHVNDFNELLGLIYHEQTTPQRIAALAPLANDAAAKGDAVATSIIEEAAKDLAQLTAAAVCRGGLGDTSVPVVLAGGVLLAGGAFAAYFRALLGASVPGAHFVTPRHSPAEGAALLALLDLARTPKPAIDNVAVR